MNSTPWTLLPINGLDDPYQDFWKEFSWISQPLGFTLRSSQQTLSPVAAEAPLLWSETLWWNSNLEHYDLVKEEFQGIKGISQNFVWANVSWLSGFNLNLFAYRIYDATFIYSITWYILPFRPSCLINRTTRPPTQIASICRGKRAAGTAPNCAGFPHHKWTKRSLPVGPGKVMPFAVSYMDFHEASDILIHIGSFIRGIYVGFADLDLFEILYLLLLTFTVWVPTRAKRY